MKIGVEARSQKGNYRGRRVDRKSTTEEGEEKARFVTSNRLYPGVLGGGTSMQELYKRQETRSREERSFLRGIAGGKKGKFNRARMSLIAKEIKRERARSYRTCKEATPT